MPTYPVNDGDIFECIIQGRLDGQTILNTFHYRVEGPTSDEGVLVAEGLGADFNDAIQSVIATVQSEGITFDATTVQKIWPIRFVASRVDAQLAALGAIAEPSLPTTVAVVARKKSLLASRHGQGRIFICGIPTTFVAESQLSPVAQAAFANVILAFSQVQGPFEGLTAFPIIFNRSDPANSVDLVLQSIDPILRVQRRREIGVGF